MCDEIVIFAAADHHHHLLRTRGVVCGPCSSLARLASLAYAYEYHDFQNQAPCQGKLRYRKETSHETASICSKSRDEPYADRLELKDSPEGKSADDIISYLVKEYWYQSKRLTPVGASIRMTDLFAEAAHQLVGVCFCKISCNVPESLL